MLMHVRHWLCSAVYPCDHDCDRTDLDIDHVSIDPNRNSFSNHALHNLENTTAPSAILGTAAVDDAVDLDGMFGVLVIGLQLEASAA